MFSLILDLLIRIRKSTQHFFEIDLFDYLNRVETRGLLATSEMKTNSVNRGFGTRYEPAYTSNIKNSLINLGLECPTIREFIFLDYGCGKGKACLLASRFGFKSVVGIEFEEDLVRTARQNGSVFSRRNCLPAPEFVLFDCADYVPPADNLVAFFFNPFSAEVMNWVIRRLLARAAEGYRIYAVYINPEHADLFSDHWTRIDAGPAPGVSFFKANPRQIKING